MGTGQGSQIARLIDHFLGRLAEVADEDDWKESEGWIGKWTIIGPLGITRVYEIRNGKFYPSTEQTTFTGEVEMSEDTFLDLIDAALHGKGEDIFAQKYARHAIRYRGDQWVVDSERFRKVLRRLGKESLRRIL